MTHETGAFNAALAVGLLWVVVRPHRAVGLLPLMTALVGLVVLVAIPDLVAGHVHWKREALHALLIAGLGLLAVLARGTGAEPPWFGNRAAGQPPASHPEVRAEAA